MALIDEMFDDMNEDFNDKCKKSVEDKISQTQSFFRKYNITRWRFVFVDFGEQLLKDYNGNYYKDNDTFSLREMKKSRGKNFGSYELSYPHKAIILSEIHKKYLGSLKTIMVAPITTKQRANSVKIEKKYHDFLEYDSYIQLDNLRHISLERVDLGVTKRRLLQHNKGYLATPILINNIKKALKKMFDL
jgi:mRNA-degrading endonuclease toxin of MazEF toxin-antitoxin module